MRNVLLAAILVLAACGGSSDPTTSGVAATDDPTSTTGVPEPAGPRLTARCGAVELPVAAAPVLPDEPLDEVAADALEQAKAAAGFEAGVFDAYEWVIAERGDDRLVLFGTTSDPATVPYADAVLDRTDDGWRPRGWGQCHIEVEAAGFGNAAWILDAAPGAADTELSVLINERNCASGEPPVGREVLPVVVADGDRVTITVLVEPVAGDASCPSNPWHPIRIALGEPLGDRTLYDGHTIPPLLRGWPPSGESVDSFGSSE